MRLDLITAKDVDALPLPGGPYNANCALNTMLRMLHKAEEWRLVVKVPRLKLSKELGRTLRLDPTGGAQTLGCCRRPAREAIGCWVAFLLPVDENSTCAQNSAVSAIDISATIAQQ
jgi:hypothetical protein